MDLLVHNSAKGSHFSAFILSLNLSLSKRLVNVEGSLAYVFFLVVKSRYDIPSFFKFTFQNDKRFVPVFLPLPKYSGTLMNRLTFVCAAHLKSVRFICHKINVQWNLQS